MMAGPGLLASGQALMQAEFLDDINLQHQVASIDEFIHRFNDRQADSDMNLRLLFNLQDEAFNPNRALDLIDSITANDTKLHFSDRDWYAQLYCTGTMQGKAVNFTLNLTVEQKGKGWYTWVLANAEGPMFAGPSLDSKNQKSISATDHELNFISLAEELEKNPQDVEVYLSASNPMNNASVFCTLIKYGILKFTGIKKTDFVFTQVPGYIFIVEDFPRNDSNAGWLISQWGRASDADKRQLLRRLSPEEPPIRPDANKGRKEAFTPIPMASDSAIQIVNAFVKKMDSFLKTRNLETLKQIENQIEGPYHFTARDTKLLALTKGNSLQYASDWQRLLNGALGLNTPLKSIVATDVTVINTPSADNATKFTTVSAKLNLNGSPTLSEQVVFYLHGNQIAGIRPLNNSQL